MALRPQTRRDSSVTPIINSFVLAPEASLPPPKRYGSSQGKHPSKLPFDPLIHKYGLTDSRTGVRRPSSLKKTKNRRPLSVSFNIPEPPPPIDTRSRRDGEKRSTVPCRSDAERATEYRIFMVSATTLTFVFTLLQPLVLFYLLMPCQEPRCYNVAMAIHESITPSVGPCQDFFGYAVGDAGTNRYFTRIERTARRAALRWVSAVDVARSGQSAVQKAAALLRACMKLTMEKNEDLDAIRNVLSAGGLQFPKMATRTNAAVIWSIVEFNLNAGLAPIFRLTAGPSLYTGEGYMLYVAPAYNVLSFADHLQQLIASDNFQVYVRRCAEVVGEPGMSYAALIRAINKVNRLFTELSVTEPVHMELKLSSSCPQTGFWRLLTAILRNKLESLGIMKTTFLVIDDVYFKFLASKVFGTLEGAEVTAYIGLYLVWYLSRVASYTLAYSSPVPNYTNELYDMWPRCFADVHTVMPFAAEQLYLQKIINDTDVHEMESIVQTVTRATKTFLSAFPREGSPSEARLIDRIGKLRIFPYTFSTLHDANQLDRLYDYVPDQEDEDYMYSYLRVSRVTAQYVLRLLHNSSVVPSGPFIPPFETSVPFMASVYNMVHLSPDTMMPPVFTFGQSLSLDYAGIGYKVAEQVAQLFLCGPSVLNESGGYERVWSSEFFNALRSKYQCLRRLFLDTEMNDTELPREAIRASVTAEILYSAYTEIRHSPAYAERFRREAEHFGLAPEQLFFVGLCMNWHQRKPRGMAELVCRFSLPSLPSFRDAFRCPRTAAYNATLSRQYKFHC